MTKIAVVVVVGILGGTIGGITLAKYGIGTAVTPSPKPAAQVLLAGAPAQRTPTQTALPASVPAASHSAETQAPPPAKPAVAQGVAEQPATKAVPANQSATAQQVLGVYTQKKDKTTEVIVFLAAPTDVKPEKLANPNRLFFDLPAAQIASSALNAVAHLNDLLLKGVRSGRSESGATRLVLDVNTAFDYKYAISSEAPYRLTINLHPQ